MIRVKSCFYKIHTETLKRIADDLRKAGAIAGVGLIGFVLAHDNIDLQEAVFLIVIGLTFWTTGLINAYLGDRMELLNKGESL
ncbi:hypothetical protein [Lonepinella sp. MS14437]|uniref:hypothetical protein n=1 Tax=unclassified Lonepinella TaxID=2642006 RepID=UPI0036DF28C9